MSCTSFLKQLTAGLTPAHKVLIKKQVKKELAKAKQAPPMLTDELHEHLNALHKAITAGHNEVVRALHEISQVAVCPMVVKHIFKPPEAPTQAADPAAA